MVAVKLLEIETSKAKDRQAATLKQNSTTVVEKIPQRENGKARDKAGKALNVSGKSVDHAATVREHGCPELIAAVERGEVSVSKAAKVAKASPHEIQMDEIADAKVRKPRKPKRTMEERGLCPDHKINGKITVGSSKEPQKPKSTPASVTPVLQTGDPLKGLLTAEGFGPLWDTALPRLGKLDSLPRDFGFGPEKTATCCVVLVASFAASKKIARRLIQEFDDENAQEREEHEKAILAAKKQGHEMAIEGLLSMTDAEIIRAVRNDVWPDDEAHEKAAPTGDVGAAS
jgi:hypothetical protein